MTPINTLSEVTKDRIEKEGELYSSYSTTIRKHYLAGKESEALRSHKLIYALENIAKGTHNAETVYQFSLRAQQFAIEVLKEYNQLP